jgi:hypothetical protein
VPDCTPVKNHSTWRPQHSPETTAGHCRLPMQASRLSRSWQAGCPRGAATPVDLGCVESARLGLPGHSNVTHVQPEERLRLTDRVVTAAAAMCVPLDGSDPTPTRNRGSLARGSIHQPGNPRRRTNPAGTERCRQWSGRSGRKRGCHGGGNRPRPGWATSPSVVPGSAVRPGGHCHLRSIRGCSGRSCWHGQDPHAGRTSWDMGTTLWARQRHRTRPIGGRRCRTRHVAGTAM